ncbi:MAG TPA: universal stress protein [Actinomycetospora sp.]|nr:universal stress protein [Actinomycetospora sp.]
MRNETDHGRDGGVVVGHSRHAGSDDAVAVAARLATRLCVPLHVVHTVSADDFPVDPDSWNAETDALRAVPEQERAVGRLLAEHVGTWTHQVERGDPAVVLTQVADRVGAPFIVVGTHGEGRGRLNSVLLGHQSVSHATVELGRHPVLVVPRGAGGPDAEADDVPAARSREG